MDRKEFLTSIGIGAVAAACSYCLGACNINGAGITGPANVNFTLDLTAPANSTLNNPGGYVYNGGVIVANTPKGFVAVSAACTHQGSTIYYDLSSNTFFCPAHGSRFDTNGAVVAGPAPSSLTKYKVSQNGNLLKVTS
jgi:cytochrome b6-f complex iron-sulfur subunit